MLRRKEGRYIHLSINALQGPLSRGTQVGGAHSGEGGRCGLAPLYPLTRLPFQEERKEGKVGGAEEGVKASERKSPQDTVGDEGGEEDYLGATERDLVSPRWCPGQRAVWPTRFLWDVPKHL